VNKFAQTLSEIWGVRLKDFRLGAHRAVVRLELAWTDHALENSAALALVGVRYSRIEFDEFVEHEVVELVSVEAEDCVLGTRIFGELSNGSFEFVCAMFYVEHVAAGGEA
jgi:hypothetical protein